jgi:uncharacterized protein YpuA (DUF1002 family)
MRLKRLTAEDFNRLASQTRMKEQTRQLAREVLVDGFSMSNVAARAGMTPQRVALAVGVIEKAYFADKEGSLGWVSLEMELPESIALQLDELAQALKVSGDQSRLAQVTGIVSAAVADARRLLD